MNTTLESVAGDIETVMREHWNRAPARFHVPLPELITEQEIFETIDCGLLSWPYFSILQDGVPQPPNETTTTRRILLKVKIDGYVHKSNAVNQFHHGSAIRFNQADDWHPRIRPFVQQLRSAFDAELHASVVLSPSGYAERLAGTEPAHVLVLQLEGEAEWTLARPSPDEPDAPARIDIAGLEAERVPLRAGDGLYIPYGRPHRVDVGDGGNSLHVVVTVAEPTVQDVVNVIAGELARRIGSTERAKRHHVIPAGQKAGWVRDQIAQYCTELDLEAVCAAAVDLRRNGG